MYKVIASGSEGNAVLYNRSVLVDCGVPFKKIKQFIDGIKLICISHEHSDHLNLSALKKIQFERPGVRILCGIWLIDKLTGLRNIDVIEPGKWFDYGTFKIAAITLFHDVPNFGFRIDFNGYKIIHCTDTAHLEGIEAKDYDLYAIEQNYDEDTVQEIIQEKRAIGEYAHQIRSINSHLSRQQATDFIYRNKGERYEVLSLHESKTSL